MENLYGIELANNINKELPNAKANYSRGQITIIKKGIEPELKAWLYSLLESLPEINHPLERIEFIIIEDGSMNLMLVINPSVFDVTAVDRAKIDGLNFSTPPESGWYEPMPLDHPWYSNKNYFKESGFLKDYALKKNYPEAHLFDKIKDQPNVKSILDDMKQSGINI